MNVNHCVKVDSHRVGNVFMSIVDWLTSNSCRNKSACTIVDDSSAMLTKTDITQQQLSHITQLIFQSYQKSLFHIHKSRRRTNEDEPQFRIHICVISACAHLTGNCFSRKQACLSAQDALHLHHSAATFPYPHSSVRCTLIRYITWNCRSSADSIIFSLHFSLLLLLLFVICCHSSISCVCVCEYAQNDGMTEKWHAIAASSQIQPTRGTALPCENRDSYSD